VAEDLVGRLNRKETAGFSCPALWPVAANDGTCAERLLGAAVGFARISTLLPPQGFAVPRRRSGSIAAICSIALRCCPHRRPLRLAPTCASWVCRVPTPARSARRSTATPPWFHLVPPALFMVACIPLPPIVGARVASRCRLRRSSLSRFMIAYGNPTQSPDHVSSSCATAAGQFCRPRVSGLAEFHLRLLDVRLTAAPQCLRWAWLVGAAF
jgi:hypothetical protein